MAGELHLEPFVEEDRAIAETTPQELGHLAHFGPLVVAGEGDRDFESVFP
jgi:hypothetical protein